MRATFAMSLAFLLLVTTAAVAQDAVPWARSIEEAQQIAAQQNRLVLVHFYGDKCPPCRALEANVFPKQDFARAVTANYVPVKINGEQPQNRQLVAKYGIKGWPTDVVIAPDGKVIAGPTICPRDAASYQAGLDRIAAQYAARQKAAANVQVAQGADAAYNTKPVGYDQPMTNDPSRYQPQSSSANPSARDPRYAAQSQQQPQQRMDDQQPDRRSAFVPPGGGGAFVQGQPYREPASGLPPRGQQGQYGSPLAAEGDPGVAVRPKQSQTDDSIYGGGGNTQPGNTAYRPNVAAPQDPRGYAANYPGNVREPAPQREWTTNPTVSVAPPRDNVNVSVAPARDPGPQAAKNPPMCLDGYCPVSMVESGFTKWVKGDARFGAIHRGRTYLFASQEAQQKFLADPDHFSPMLSGYDAVKYIEKGELVEGTRKFGAIHKDKMYLFADEAAMVRFERQPEAYLAPVQQAMQGGPTRR
jgi:YHS domain-containing protein/thiol-disulfide isomerase/thioredoxin